MNKSVETKYCIEIVQNFKSTIQEQTQTKFPPEWADSYFM